MQLGGLTASLHSSTKIFQEAAIAAQSLSPWYGSCDTSHLGSTLNISCPLGPFHHSLIKKPYKVPAAPWPQMRQSTCPPGGPLSCRLNICLMAISCLNMSWAKPLMNSPRTNGSLLGPLPCPHADVFLRDCVMFSPPFVHPVCLSAFHGQEGGKDLLHRGQGR